MTTEQPHRRADTRGTAFRVLCGFLLLLPFGLVLPGNPGSLKGDEAAYYLMALSLAWDGDLRLEAEDTERLFEEFPLRRTRNTVVMSSDGWQTVHYGKPHLYPLLAAPFARLFGYRGLLLFNMLLLVGSIALLGSFLRRLDPRGPTLLFAAAFFLLGATWNYAFWIQPEILSAFCVTGALAWGLRRPGVGGVRLPPLATALGSGALLAVAVYNKPYLAPLGLPLVAGALSQARTVGRPRAVRWLAVWAVGALAALTLAAGSAWILTGSPSSYVGVDRDSVPVICEPGETPRPPSALAAEAAAAAVAAEAAKRGAPTGVSSREDGSEGGGDDAMEPPSKSWSWIFRIPPVTPGEVLENVVYFLVGRHTGLLVYFPFVGVALFLFLRETWRRRRADRSDPLQVERWTLLASALGIGLFLLVFISWNWQGGGGFVGNRYFVIAVPAFAFLVSRIRSPRPLAAGAVVAGLFLGPMLLGPFGLLVPEPTLQAHTRSAPFRLLPLEHTLKNVPGYRVERVGGLRLRGRADRWLARGDSLWTFGGQSTDLVVLSEQRLGPTAFLVRHLADRPGRVEVALGGDRRSLELGPGEARVLTLDPAVQRRRHNPNHLLWHVVDLEVRTQRGAVLPWERHMPPNPCPDFVRNDVFLESFYAGAEVTPLGPAERLDRTVFGARWEETAVPKTMVAGSEERVPVRIRNASDSTWPADGGAARVKLSYHWLTGEGQPVTYDGRRTELPAPLEAGSAADVQLLVEPPERPGRYVLELDLVLEYVGWFSDRGVEAPRFEVTVVEEEEGSTGEGP